MSENTPTVLVLDDDSTILAGLKKALQPRFDVQTFSTIEAFEQALHTSPKVPVVLVDQNLGTSSSGLEILKKIKITSPTTVRILLTGHLDLRDMQSAVNESLVHRVIAKPWDVHWLTLQMVECLQLHFLLEDRQQLEKLSVTDPITQLYNHRFFQERLKVEVNRAERAHKPLSLIMVDVDHFKSFNDHYGHPQGDQLLFSIAQKLLQMLRTHDFVARYGGEEFSLILPDTEAITAFEVAERIRKEVDEFAFTGPLGRPATITLSLGVAAFPAHGTNPKDLISAADRALYQAKRQGRNQVVMATL